MTMTSSRLRAFSVLGGEQYVKRELRKVI
jgi:hypothetical protein